MFKAALDNPAMSNALKATGLDKGFSIVIYLKRFQYCFWSEEIQAQFSFFSNSDSQLKNLGPGADGQVPSSRFLASTR